MLLMATLCSQAQTPMPLNPQVRHGKLDNGLNYYILHNEEPKQRANFYIAQKVGSTLETPEQLGLAHFPSSTWLSTARRTILARTCSIIFQSKGLRFGADINAYTSFDETVYNIDNVPTTNKALMDGVFAIYDWSCNILLEEAEINAERGVIEGSGARATAPTAACSNPSSPSSTTSTSMSRLPLENGGGTQLQA